MHVRVTTWGHAVCIGCEIATQSSSLACHPLAWDRFPLCSVCVVGTPEIRPLGKFHARDPRLSWHCIAQLPGSFIPQLDLVPWTLSSISLPRAPRDHHLRVITF